MLVVFEKITVLSGGCGGNEKIRNNPAVPGRERLRAYGRQELSAPWKIPR
jgi:hypothetical protein